MDELLPTNLRDLRKDIRAFAVAHVAPIVCCDSFKVDNNNSIPQMNDYYERAEFPMHLIEKLRELNLCGGDIPRQYGGAGLSCLANGLIAMELARVDVGIATFFGILQPISMSPIYKCGMHACLEL